MSEQCQIREKLFPLFLQIFDENLHRSKYFFKLAQTYTHTQEIHIINETSEFISQPKEEKNVWQ